MTKKGHQKFLHFDIFSVEIEIFSLERAAFEVIAPDGTFAPYATGERRELRSLAWGKAPEAEKMLSIKF